MELLINKYLLSGRNHDIS